MNAIRRLPLKLNICVQNICKVIRRQIYVQSCLNESICLKFPSKVPEECVSTKIDPSRLPPRTKLNPATIHILQQLSMFDCVNEENIKAIEDAIAFADIIHCVDTDDILPLITVLEDRPLELRDDTVTEGNIKNDIFANSSFIEDDYFVGPPTNTPRKMQ